MAVIKWKFEDPYDSNPATRMYTFAVSPNEMTSPFPQRAITTMTTTAVSGQSLFFEGRAPSKEWSFSGTLLTRDQYEALRSWVYERNRRVIVHDHYGRKILCVLRDFDPKPKRSLQHYWRHEWTITALVVSVSKPTVGEIW